MSPRTKILLGLSVAALAFGLRILPGPRTIDDAYITFRYARNLLDGDGPVYNPGEPVLGTTTPLYMGLLSALSLPLGGSRAPFPEIAMAINALADALACLVLIGIGKSLRSEPAGWAAALVWAVSPMSVTFAIGGLETSVYILLLLTVLYCRLLGKFTAMSILAGLAFLARPDALILLALVWAELVFALTRREGFREGIRKAFIVSLPLLLLLAGWLTFASVYYGTLLPNSLLAKSVAYRLDPGSALVRMIQHYGTPFNEDLTFGSGVLIVTAPLYLFLSLLGILSAEKLRPRIGAAAGLAFPWAYLLAFAAANPLIFRWYLAPPSPFLLLSIFMGMAALLGLPRAAAFPRVRRILFAALAAGALLLSMRDWTLSPDHGPARPAPQMAYIRLELVYQKVAEDIRSRILPGYTVAAGDVGVLGYMLDAPILDTVGLNSPEAVPYYPLPESLYATIYAVPPDLILAALPEIVVVQEGHVRNGLLKDPRFLEQYELCGRYPAEIYGGNPALIYTMLVYCRKDLA
jgi:arabinofuranosyltransferase